MRQTFTYIRIHIPSGQRWECPLRAFSRDDALREVNTWNRMAEIAKHSEFSKVVWHYYLS